MKNFQRMLNGLMVGAVVMAMVATVAAQNVVQGSAKVVRIKGSARYSTVANQWQPLKVGAVLAAGTVVQTGMDKGSYVDLVLGDGSGVIPVASGGAGAASAADTLRYQPSAQQNIVRLWENTLLGIDKLTTTETGADVVTDTQLDLRAGRIFGSVKKMTAASKYEIKLPNGVAGVRGTIYDISADGVVRVLSGQVVVAWVAADGTVTTQVVNAGQQFDARSGQISPIPEFNQKEMIKAAKDARIAPNTPPTTFVNDSTIYYVSPNQGKNGGGADAATAPARPGL
jgi:hypothetical protein